MMDAARWDRIQTLFHEALAQPEDRRAAFVESASRGERGLAAEVLALLEEDALVAPLLDHGIADVAEHVLGGLEPAPRRLGAYRLVGVLGEGGMGTVYLAERDDLGSRAAIKMLRDAYLSPARRERFASEQRMLARLSHPNIARLYDAGTLPDGTPYFVMEHVEGVQLMAYCEANGCGVEERLRLFRAVCEAVQFAHRHAVVHRDLKPSNVLVTADGTVKLLDFGIAKQLDAAGADTDRTKTALRLMTPAYAAPEQIRGDPIGTYTDVYALGVTLYELLTGKLPFDLSRLTPGQAGAVLLEREPERPSVAARKGAAPAAPPAGSVGAAAWADLDVLCLTAMQKDPARRYRTVDALIADIDHYLRREPLEARADTAGYRLRKFLQRNWRPVSLAAAVLASVVALVAFYTVRLAAARDAALAEAARTQRIQGFVMNLFEGGDEAVGPADTLRVVTLVDRGVREARVLDAEPGVQAELYETLGRIYQKLGNFPRADSLLQAALEQRRSILGPAAPDVGASLLALGLLRVDQARVPDAERLIRQGLETTRHSLPPEHPAMLRAVTALGRVLEERGAYDTAVAVLDDAVRLEQARAPSSPELSTTLGYLADTHFYAGHYAVADSLNRVLLELNQRLYGERHPSVADKLINLGAVQFQWGHYEDAERLYRRALDIMKAYYGPEHYEVASTMTMLARALVYENRHAEALDLLHRGLAIEERVYGPDHPRVASALNELGNVAARQGDYPAAEAYFRRMAGIYRKVYGEKHYLLGIALSNLANTFLERGRNEEAEPLFRQALAVMAATLPADHLNVGVVHIKLGRTLLREHRYAEAERESRLGYDIVAKQSDPTVSWLKAARTDLAIEYDTLRRPAEAERFRKEADALEGASPKKP
ncbi:MAG TPA: serine/threonine-protein kinase [Longimicrobiales bacterium]|nr:serine/threonine-protein kinase [Longimicrobiales bacterium]